MNTGFINLGRGLGVMASGGFFQFEFATTREIGSKPGLFRAARPP
jgi:hypothetical protein